MTLHIQSLTFRDFRNYDALSLAELGKVTVFVGRNAVGKTNIIEGIQLLTALTSFRHASIDQLVRHRSEAGQLQAHLTDGNRELDLEVLLQDHGKKYRLNGKAKRPADLKGLIPSVIFTPDDLDLVKGAMARRRTVLDGLGSQVNKNYYVVRRDYEKVLRHKNRLLKEEASEALIQSINEMVITCGSQLSCFRAALFARLEPLLVDHYRTIAGGREALSARFVPSWASTTDEPEDGESFLEEGTPWDNDHSFHEVSNFSRDEAREALGRALHERAAEERARHRAVVGPQGDRIEFLLDGQNASLFGSQGQQRSIVLAYKLAEAAVIEDILDQKPVLLLDDVMSELDGARREALVESMAKGSQTFITTANLAYFDEGMLARSDIVELPLAEPRRS